VSFSLSSYWVSLGALETVNAEANLYWQLREDFTIMDHKNASKRGILHPEVTREAQQWLTGDLDIIKSRVIGLFVHLPAQPW
jgi:hypothetical protein